MAGSVQAPPGGGISVACLPLLPLTVFTLLSLAAGVAVERQATLVDSCQGILYARACLAEVQLLQTQATVWFSGAAAVVLFIAIDRAASRRGRRLVAPPAALLAYGLFLVAWGILGILVSQWEGFGQLPRGTGLTFLLIYTAASLLLFAGAFVRPRSDDAVARAAAVVAAAQGLLGTIIGLTWAYFLVFPPIIAT